MSTRSLGRSDARQEAAREQANTSEITTIEHRSIHRGRHAFECVWLVSLFTALVGLAFLFPPNGDDWAWGSQIGLDRLHSGFADYNGRYVANLVVLALTRMPILAPFIVGGALTAIVFLIVDISRNRTPWGYAITTALLLAMPAEVWNQTISWLSGFTNYSLTTVWVLLFIRLIQRDWLRTQRPRFPMTRLVAIFFLSTLTALFIENVTIFFVIAAATVLLAMAVMQKRFSSLAATWLVGALIGAVTMFSNGAYQRAVDSGGDSTSSYQTVSPGIRGIVLKLLTTVSKFAIVDNFILNIALAAAIGIAVFTVTKRRGWHWRVGTLAFASAFIGIAAALHVAGSAGAIPANWNKLSGLAAGFAVLAVCGASLGMTLQRRIGILACTASIIALVLPLAVVNPIGPRLFLVTYGLILILINSFASVSRELTTGRGMIGMAALGTTITVAFLCAYFVIFAAITNASNQRLANIRQEVAAGATHVTVPRLPFSSYMHVPDPEPGVWATRYKLFHSLPSSLTIDLANR